MLYLSKVAVFNLICFNLSVTVLHGFKFHTLLNKLECFYPSKYMQPSMLAAQIILGQKKILPRIFASEILTCDQFYCFSLKTLSNAALSLVYVKKQSPLLAPVL